MLAQAKKAYCEFRCYLSFTVQLGSRQVVLLVVTAGNDNGTEGGCDHLRPR